MKLCLPEPEKFCLSKNAEQQSPTHPQPSTHPIKKIPEAHKFQILRYDWFTDLKKPVGDGGQLVIVQRELLHGGEELGVVPLGGRERGQAVQVVGREIKGD